MSRVGILIIDDDRQSQMALRQILDSDGWKVSVVPLVGEALKEMATGEWSLVLVNVAMTGLDGPLFSTLKELALAPSAAPAEEGGFGASLSASRNVAAAPAVEPGLGSSAGASGNAPAAPAEKRIRVLFLVPELAATQAQPVLERDRLPYALKPIHLHDFLEKVGDLLIEARAIDQPIRRVRYEYKSQERRTKDRRKAKDRRDTSMFAAREDYQMTEEEIAEYEQQEAEKKKRKK